MDPLTWVSLGLQLAALCSIVGALLLYLLRKVRVAEIAPTDSAKTVLVTSVDTALGLQIATYLSSRGWRVIAGCRRGGLGARLAESWLAAHTAATENHPAPRLSTLELDVAREDLLEEAARATAQHLPAGEHGIWAVINTAGSGGRGGATCWESVLKGNVLGSLRVAKTFSPLLAAAAGDHPHAGRLFYIGLTSDTACESLARSEGGELGEACAGAAAARWGVWGAARSLRASLRSRGVSVVLLNAPDLPAADVYAPPSQLTPSSQPSSRPDTPTSETGTLTGSCSVTMPGEAAEYSAKVLPTAALKTLEDALTTPSPRDAYYLKMKQESWFTRVPSLRITTV